MVTIMAGSSAHTALAKMLANPNVYKISVDVRRDGVALKANEHMWTPTLSVEYVGGSFPEWTEHDEYVESTIESMACDR